MTLREERLNVTRKQCSGIFLLTKNITTKVPGNYKIQLRDSLAKLKDVPLDDQNRDILRTCKEHLINYGEEESLCNMIDNVCRGSISEPNLF
jgi:hypothetical protein